MIIAFWLIMGLVVAYIASKKGRSFVGWFIYGILLWPIALIHIALSSNNGQKCTKCFSNIDSRATICPFCKHKITAEELKIRNESRNESQNKKFIAIAVIAGLFFIPYSIISSSVNRQANLIQKVNQDLKNEVSNSQTSNKVPYSVKVSGSLNYILLDSKYNNKEDLTVLGQELNLEYKNSGFIRISVYDNIKAVEIRDNVVNEKASQSDNTFYDNHYIAQYNKNGSTNYNEFVIHPMSEAKKIDY